MVARRTLTYRRRVPYPVDIAYAWLTDYADDDPDRTEEIIKRRPVVERTDEMVVLDATIEIFGKNVSRRAEIDLMPPNRWRARAIDKKGRTGDVYEYRLEPREGGATSELIVDYHFITPKFKHKLQLALLRRSVYRKLDKMWDGFFAAMADEVGAPEVIT